MPMVLIWEKRAHQVTEDYGEELSAPTSTLVVNWLVVDSKPFRSGASWLLGGDAALQKPQVDKLVMLHDDQTDDGDDEDGEEEVLLRRSSNQRNQRFKGRAEESIDNNSQQPQIISHIAPAKVATSASTAASPLKTASHIALARHPHDEADDICLVPEIDFEGMSTDAGSDNRESQPLLGGGSASHGSRISELLGGLGRGHDHVEFVSNTFGGECAAD